MHSTRNLEHTQKQHQLNKSTKQSLQKQDEKKKRNPINITSNN